jgi:hypothetical protein
MASKTGEEFVGVIETAGELERVYLEVRGTRERG